MVSGFDQRQAEQHALRIAGERDISRAEHYAALKLTGSHRPLAAFWERRAAFKFGVEAGSPDQIAKRARDEVAKAAAVGHSPAEALVVISDSGDNPTGGGVGDTPSMLQALLEAGIGDAVV